VNKDSAKRFAMIFRICEFLISSVKTSPAGTNGFAASTVSVFVDAVSDAGAVAAAVCGVKFSISLFTIRPFSPEPFT